MKKQYKTLIIVQIVIIILIILSFLLIKSGYTFPTCIYKEKFGIICPACYGTTFAIEMFNFNFAKAFLAHPLFFILAVYLALIDLIYIINVLFNRKINIFKWWHVLVWIVILIIYTIIRNLL